LRSNENTKREIKDIVIADAVLIIAFSMTLSGGIFGLSRGSPFGFVVLIPAVALGVSLSFILHELMHKFVAQHYGAIAGFRTSYNGLIVTLLTGAFGFLLGIPGATMIYTNSFTKRENGIVSLAGPLTNFVVFGIFVGLLFALNPPNGSYLGYAINLTIFISILLAFFNMLPIYPLDGSKVLAWNKEAYFITMGTIFVLMLAFHVIGLIDIIFMIGIAIFFSLFYRNMM